MSRGALCGKCALAYNGVWRDAEARLTRPLRRAGKKGSGRFEPISWEEALSEAAAALHDAVRAGGPGSVVHAHYTGTCSVLAGHFPMRFFNRLGATEVEPDTICNNAGHVALRYVLGTSTTGFDPRTARDSRCIVVWGANPSASAPHAHKHWLGETQAEIIVVDPVRHETARSADRHLQPFPGADAALAFAWLNVLLREGLCDESFLRDHTLGFEELEPFVRMCTPAWGERLTGVPAADIEAAARAYGRGPSLLWLGQGLQRQPRGGNAMRACAMLPALSGNIGRPGAGIYYLNGAGPRNIDGKYVEAPHLRQEPPSSLSHMELASVLQRPDRSRAFVCWNMNVAASAPRQQALQRALSREDLFTIVVDLFATDTADYADLVLPAASFLEFDDLVVPYFHLHVSAQVKASEAPGEALPNQEIFRRLARAMDYGDPELYETDEDILYNLLSRSGLGVTFGDLKGRGTLVPWPEPVVAFADGRFPTPSGRIEIASVRAEADGHPRLPEPWADPRPGPNCARLLSPASAWQLNDSYGNDEHIGRTLGPARAAIHPDDARRLGIAEGDAVELSNQTGSLVLSASLSDEVLPGVVLAHKGRWPKLEPTGANVNVLNPGDESDMGASSSVHGVQVSLRKAGATVA